MGNSIIIYDMSPLEMAKINKAAEKLKCRPSVLCCAAAMELATEILNSDEPTHVVSENKFNLVRIEDLPEDYIIGDPLEVTFEVTP